MSVFDKALDFVKENPAEVAGTAAGIFNPVAGIATGLGIAGGKGFAKQQESGLRPVKSYKDMLKEQTRLLQQDPSKLGMTEAQRRQMQSEAQQADASQRQAQVQQLGQQALAGGPVAQNQLQQAAQTVAQQGGEAAAKTSADIGKLNQRLIEQRKQQIWSDLDGARQRAREDAQFWSQFGLDASAALASVAGLV